LSQDHSKGAQGIEVITGWKGIKNTFNVLIKDVKKAETWFAFGMPEQMSEERARFFSHWRKQTDKIGIHQKLIANKKIKGSAELAPDSPFSDIRYSNQETPTTVDIFRDNTILSIWSKKPILIHVKSKEVSDSFKAFFDSLWKSAKK